MSPATLASRLFEMLEAELFMVSLRALEALLRFATLALPSPLFTCSASTEGTEFGAAALCVELLASTALPVEFPALGSDPGASETLLVLAKLLDPCCLALGVSAGSDECEVLGKAEFVVALRELDELLWLAILALPSPVFAGCTSDEAADTFGAAEPGAGLVLPSVLDLLVLLELPCSCFGLVKVPAGSEGCLQLLVWS